MDWTLLGLKGLHQVLNIHPVFVHFPIALFPTAFLFYFLGTVFKKTGFLFAGRMSLVLAFLSSSVTVLTGEWAAESFPHNETIHHLMETHETIGFAILIAAGLLVLWSFVGRENRRCLVWGFLVLLGMASLLVLQNADLGGRMVFVEGASVRKAADKQPPSHHH